MKVEPPHSGRQAFQRSILVKVFRRSDATRLDRFQSYDALIVQQRVHLDGSLVGLVVRPVENRQAQRDERRVQQLYGVLELELLPFPERVLSKMFEAGIIDLPEHGGTTMAVLVGHGGLGRSLADAQVVKVPRGGPQSVTDVTDRGAVCKLAENHADKLAPSVKSLAELVGVALAYDALDYFFRESRYCLPP